jgi:hypothetical protein
MKVLVAAAIGAMFAGAAMAQTADRPYGVGTTQQGSLGYAFGSAIAKVATESGDVRSIVQPYGGSSTFVPLVNRGELDFGVVNALETILAKSGSDTFDGKPNPDLRAVAALMPSYVSFVVRKDSGIKSVTDLKGKKLPWGFTSQTIVQYMLNGAMAAAGLKEDDVQKFPVPNINRQMDDFAAGRVDTTFTALGTPRTQEVDAQLGGVRFISLADSPSQAAIMTKMVPGTYIGKIEPGPGRFAVVEPTSFMAYMFLLIAGTKAPDEAVYKVAAALHAHKADLVASHPSFRAFEPERMAQPVEGVAYHPGAIRFYREKGIWPAS